MFYDNFIKLCRLKGVTPSKATTDIGLNRASVIKWRNGAMPNGRSLHKMADYFGVSADYLLGTGSESQKDEEWAEGEEGRAFFRLKKGLESHKLNDADVDFLLTVYEAHKKQNDD